MTDHAGSRRCECHPGTNFWHPPIEVTQFAPEERFWRPFFCKAKKDYIDQEAGEECETKVVGNSSVTVLYTTEEFIFVWSFKNGNGSQNLVPG